MNQSNALMMVFVTASNKTEAQTIASGLLNDRLAACVNVLDSVDSFFWWEGKIDQAREVLLIIKTTHNLMELLIQKVKSLHSYQTPEIIALPIAAGSADYVQWVKASVQSS